MIYYWHKGAMARWKEDILFWIVWRLPKTLVYFCALRLGANATTGKYGDTVVPDLTFMDALGRWED